MSLSWGKKESRFSCSFSTSFVRVLKIMRGRVFTIKRYNYFKEYNYFKSERVVLMGKNSTIATRLLGKLNIRMKLICPLISFIIFFNEFR